MSESQPSANRKTDRPNIMNSAAIVAITDVIGMTVSGPK
jgi:hypothetical protein